jgi:hypothetical protein
MPVERPVLLPKKPQLEAEKRKKNKQTKVPK